MHHNYIIYEQVKQKQNSKKDFTNTATNLLNLLNLLNNFVTRYGGE